MYMDKVKNFCDHSMILWEMAANRKPTGHFWTTPASFRVKEYLCNKLLVSKLWAGKNEAESQKSIIRAVRLLDWTWSTPAIWLTKYWTQIDLNNLFTGHYCKPGRIILVGLHCKLNEPLWRYSGNFCVILQIDTRSHIIPINKSWPPKLFSNHKHST